MTDIDWASVGERLYADTCSTFSRFSRDHPGEVCSHVSYHSDPLNGYVLLGFDPPTNWLGVARRRQEQKLPFVREMLERTPWQQRDAHRFLRGSSLLPLNLSSGELAFPEAVVWMFPEWEEFASSDAYEAASRGADLDGDPLRAALALCLWRLVDRLAAERAFDELPLARPCLVSYQDHDSPLVGLRVLNFPPD